MKYDLVIIGGGPGGYAAAIRAAKLGARTVLVEKERVGGTCLHRGCIPTKVLAHGTGLVSLLKQAGQFGLIIKDYSFDYAGLVQRKNQVVEQLATGVEFLLRSSGVQLVTGTGSLAGPGKVLVSSAFGTTELAAEKIILATGSDPPPAVHLGYDGRLVINSNDALELERVPRSLLVLGGGAVGCEFATIFGALGSRVTLVEKMSRLLPGMDEDVSREIEKAFRRRGLELKTGTAVNKVHKRSDEVHVWLDNGKEIVTELVLVTAGRIPKTRDLGLDTIGLGTGTESWIEVNEHLETRAPGIYAVGDVTGRRQLAHLAAAQGLAAVDHILGRPLETDFQVITTCVYTSPTAAGVGATGQELRDQGIPFKTGRFPLPASGIARATGETEGFVKVLAHAETGGILGVHAVGVSSADLMAEGALAVRFGITARQLAGVIHAHPTFSECLSEAAAGVFGLGTHI